MKPAVYLETTLVSYLVARPSENLIVAAHQELTRQWWREHLRSFRGVISQFVLDEARDGEPVMVRMRLKELRRFPRLPITAEALALGRALLPRISSRQNRFWTPPTSQWPPRMGSISWPPGTAVIWPTPAPSSGFAPPASGKGSLVPSFARRKS